MTETPDTPANPFSPRQVRALKISIAIMTILIVLGIGALIYGMARQAARIGEKPASQTSTTAPYSKTLRLGVGDLHSVSTSDGLIILNWRGENGHILVTIDPKSGVELGRIALPRQ